MCFNGILSHKLRNHTHLGEYISFLPKFYTRTQIWFTNAIVFSLVDGRLINTWQDILLHLLPVKTDLIVGIHYCRQVAVLICSCLAVVLWDFSCPLLSFSEGIRSFRRDCFEIASDVMGILLPDFWFTCSATKKVSEGCIPFSTTSFNFSLSLLLLYGGGEN